MDYGACCRHSRMYGTWITAHVVGYSWMNYYFPTEPSEEGDRAVS